MRLRQLIDGLPGVALRGDGAVLIQGVSHDSRQIQPGWLYVALPGRRVDGRAFIDAALKAGAAAVAVAEGAPVVADVPVLTLAEPRPALAQFAARLHGQPAQSLRLVGITGTNGKTTIATLLADICTAAGWPEGLIGTNGVRVAGVEHTAQFTTPESPELQALLARMVRAEVPVAVMEVSSVGLSEHRVDATPFAAAAFTNLSVDHLDYHGDLAQYGAAKRRLFTELLAPGAPAVINVEDPFGAALAEQLDTPWRLALDGRSAEVRVPDLQVDAHGMRGTLVTPVGSVVIRCPLLGRFNALNVATAGALALAMGLPPEAVQAGLAHAAIPGRMQRVGGAAEPLVVVDYAHSPDAIERVIETLRPLTEGHLWVVFGCGGDRDATKRGPMGRAAAVADGVIVTSDNPRSEDPRVIAEAAAAGAVAAGRPLQGAPQLGGTWLQLDRRAAIEAAIAAAAPGDTVLVAGKGHEAYQEIAGVRQPFDDAAEVRAALTLRARPTTADLCAVAEGTLLSGTHQPLGGVSIDTRTLAPGACFFCLRGPRFDAHDFAANAVNAGAAVLVVEAGHAALDAITALPATVIAVLDPTDALARVAALHRSRFTGEIIGLTGSSGKTTTKEMVAAALATAGSTHRTRGNLNNHLGLPLTLLGLRADHRFAVVELGMSALGEIAFLASLARPRLGVVTTVGTAHLETLGSQANIAQAKGELFAALPADGLAIYPSHINHAAALTAALQAPRLTVGVTAADTVRASNIGEGPSGATATVHVGAQQWPLQLQFSGAHHVDDALLALAVAHTLRVPIGPAIEALEALAPPALRGEVRHLPDGSRVVLDCYNANPESMWAAVSTFLRRTPTGTLVLGDMLELGTDAPAQHAEIGARLAAQSTDTTLIGVGPLAAHLVSGAIAAGLPAHRAHHVASAQAAADVLTRERSAGEAILLKGSRGMRLEQVWTALAPLPPANKETT
jgi:murE/murF fusion protein